MARAHKPSRTDPSLTSMVPPAAGPSCRGGGRDVGGACAVAAAACVVGLLEPKAPSKPDRQHAVARGLLLSESVTDSALSRGVDNPARPSVLRRSRARSTRARHAAARVAESELSRVRCFARHTQAGLGSARGAVSRRSGSSGRRPARQARRLGKRDDGAARAGSDRSVAREAPARLTPATIAHHPVGACCNGISSTVRAGLSRTIA